MVKGEELLQHKGVPRAFEQVIQTLGLTLPSIKQRF